MKRILTLGLCLGLASALAIQAAPEMDKAEKKVRRANAKVAQKGKGIVRANSGRAPGARMSRATAPQIQAQMKQGRATVRRRGPANFSWSYNEARRYYNRGVRRDRSWYASRYHRFALFAGGYYYFDRGYWYPAYGYDSAYSTYRFDEPIYGYNSLDPHQVIVNVQVELQRQGYYRGSIDGMIGPMTRAALSAYQRDRGLDVTRAIDGPTLAALGLT